MSDHPLTVEDRAAIDDLFARYAWALDRGDDDAFSKVFTRESTIEDPSGRYSGRDAPHQILAAMRANTTFPGRQHWIAPPVLEGSSEDARARSFVMVTSRHETGATNLHLVAAYFDRLTKVQGEWLIADRLIRVWRGDLLARFPEMQNRPDWARAQSRGS